MTIQCDAGGEKEGLDTFKSMVSGIFKVSVCPAKHVTLQHILMCHSVLLVNNQWEELLCSHLQEYEVKDNRSTVAVSAGNKAFIFWRVRASFTLHLVTMLVIWITAPS